MVGPAPVDGALQPLQEGQPVRQAGQAVVVGRELQLLLGGAAVGDVVELVDQTRARRAGVLEAAGMERDPDIGSPPQEPNLHGGRQVIHRAHGLQVTRQERTVLGDDQVDEWLPDQALFVPADQSAQ